METKEVLEQKHLELVNLLINISNEKEEIWKFHPDNPNRIDIVDYYNMLEADTIQIESEIEECWNDITSY